MMAHCQRPPYRTRRRGKVPRSTRNRVISGVCGGLAEHFDLNPTWVRIGFVIATPITSGAALLVYLVCLIVMPSPNSSSWKRAQEQIAPPPIPTFVSEEVAFDHLDRQFNDIEARIRGLEDHVTSREYVLKRKFESL